MSDSPALSRSDIPPGLHGGVTRNTGFLISRMGLVAARRFAEQIATVGLAPQEWGVLNVLDQDDGITQHMLSKGIGMDPSSMVATIDGLESKGLAERRRNPRDRRAHAVHITDKGRRTLTEGRKVARRAQDELLAPLDHEERAQLHALLLRLAGGPAAQATLIATSPEGAGAARKRARPA